MVAQTWPVFSFHSWFYIFLNCILPYFAINLQLFSKCNKNNSFSRSLFFVEKRKFVVFCSESSLAAHLLPLFAALRGGLPKMKKKGESVSSLWRKNE